METLTCSLEDVSCSPSADKGIYDEPSCNKYGKQLEHMGLSHGPLVEKN